MTFPTASMVTTAGQVILTKPVTLEKIEPTSVATNQQGMATVNLGDLVRLKSQHKMEGVDHAGTTGNILHITTPTTSACNNQIHVSTTDHGISVLKGLIEPLPASALKGLIKIEPSASNTVNTPTLNPAVTANSCNNYSFIKVEQPDLMTNHMT